MCDWDSVGSVDSTRPAETVLVVDDDLRILALTGEMLRLGGYRVLNASLASEAILIFERNAAEIDIALRQRNPDLPIVFMTGCAESRDTSGALQKPFRMVALWSKIADALNSPLAATLARHSREMETEA